jgi:hypothetical protein
MIIKHALRWRGVQWGSNKHSSPTSPDMVYPAFHHNEWRSHLCFFAAFTIDADKAVMPLSPPAPRHLTLRNPQGMKANCLRLQAQTA